MPEAKTKEHEDIKFSRDALTDPDPRKADSELEKRNKPMPEGMRKDPSKVFGWPPPEDRLPAVMPADKQSDHDYKQETYDVIDDEARDKELTSVPGQVAREELARVIREGGPKLDMNKVQAPPSVNAEAAAEGGGAQSNPVPVTDRSGRPLPPLGGAAIAAATAAVDAANASKSSGKK